MPNTDDLKLQLNYLKEIGTKLRKDLGYLSDRINNVEFEIDKMKEHLKNLQIDNERSTSITNKKLRALESWVAIFLSQKNGGGGGKTVSDWQEEIYRSAIKEEPKRTSEKQEVFDRCFQKVAHGYSISLADQKKLFEWAMNHSFPPEKKRCNTCFGEGSIGTNVGSIRCADCSGKGYEQ